MSWYKRWTLCWREPERTNWSCGPLYDAPEEADWWGKRNEIYRLNSQETRLTYVNRFNPFKELTLTMELTGVKFRTFDRDVY